MVNLIQASNINVSRQGNKILENVSVVVGDHDFLTIIGPNGAGKSMLLKCLMGFYAPDIGEIQKMNGLRVGYVPQHFAPEHTMPISVKRFLGLRKKQRKQQWKKLPKRRVILKI